MSYSHIKVRSFGDLSEPVSKDQSFKRHQIDFKYPTNCRRGKYLEIPFLSLIQLKLPLLVPQSSTARLHALWRFDVFIFIKGADIDSLPVAIPVEISGSKPLVILSGLPQEPYIG